MAERLGRKGWTVMYEEDDGAEATSPVGKFPLGDSPFGLSDMAGNVWEWVEDWYAPYKDSQRPIPDPRVAVKPPGDKGTRVCRGGSWFMAKASSIRTAFRASNDVADRDHLTGFRCAREPQ
jgi:formylglycine-generating enzyme required for sulfatase activity